MVGRNTNKSIRYFDGLVSSHSKITQRADTHAHAHAHAHAHTHTDRGNVIVSIFVMA